MCPPPVRGPRPNSLFASNTSELKHGEDLDFLQAIGMKVERAHFAPPVQTRDPNWAVTLPPGEAVALDFSKQDKNWELTKVARSLDFTNCRVFVGWRRQF